MNDNRRRLIEALRAPMPEGFEWDFMTWYGETECGTVGCAIGLAHELWPKINLADANIQEIGIFFDLTPVIASRVFLSTVYYDDPKQKNGVIFMKDVKPEMVADVLERLP